MQLPRIIIAAVFFVIGALIAIPALTRSNSSSQASSQPTSSQTATPPRTPPRTPTPTPTRSSPRPTPTKTTPTPTPTRSRTTPPATPSRSVTSTPAVPLTATIGAVQCPARTVTVRVQNVGNRAQDYTIEQDGTPTVADRLGAGASRTSRLTLDEDESTRVGVVWNERSVRSATRKANCSKPEPAPQNNLPRTGPESAATFAKVATGVAAMITGLIIFWYGGIWPRRRDQIRAEK